MVVLPQRLAHVQAPVVPLEVAGQHDLQALRPALGELGVGVEAVGRLPGVVAVVHRSVVAHVGLLPGIAA